ncbi:MAG: TonB-dependent receptor [Gemmatimonadetes bacterium]|nr:TonB-dependent receptor [Gemmatimonadota bacterium]
MTGSTLLATVALPQAALVGEVRDSITLEPVAFAEVTVAHAEAADPGIPSVRADRHGAFVLRAGPLEGPYRVVARALGYAVWEQVLESMPNGALTVLLSPIPSDLEALVVGGGRAGDPLSLSRDAFVIDSHVMETMPPVLESDVLRVALISPSASPPSDYLSVPFIRGGTAEGTPVLLDGVRLFNAFHAGGFVSAINPEAVDHARVLPSSGGEAFGVGSLSGAFDIATRDGARDRTRTSGALGIGSARLTVEGPVGQSTSFLASGRRTWIDRVTQAAELAGLIEEHIPYFFRDLHGKVTSDLGGVRRLSVSGYLSTESFSTPRISSSRDTVPDRDTVRRGNWDMHGGGSALSVHYRDRVGDGGILDARLMRGRFASDLYSRARASVGFDGPPVDDADPADGRYDTLVNGSGSMISEGAEAEVSWREGRSRFAVGARAERLHGDLDLAADEHWLVQTFSVRRSLWRIAAHAQAESPLAGGFGARGGARVDRFTGLGATTLGGFAELAYRAPSWGARVAGARSHQALASTRDEEALMASYLAYDFLVPVGGGPVPANTEVTVGWDGELGPLRLRVDSYWRWLENLRMPHYGARVLDRPVLGDPGLWELAEGSARGIETSWSWVRERGLSVLGSYRWAVVTRTQEGIAYTPRFHRDHELEMLAAYRGVLGSVSAQLSFRSGQPQTPWLGDVWLPGYRDSFGHAARVGGWYNSGRLRHYARVDVSWRREWRVGWFGGGELTPYVSVANLFDTPNVVAWLPTWDGEEWSAQIPLVPFAGVEFRF